MRGIGGALVVGAGSAAAHGGVVIGRVMVKEPSTPLGYSSGVPILDQWDLTQPFRYPTPPRVEVGHVFRIEWSDSAAAKIDTVVRRP
jgi:hypothetical protein